MHPIPPGQGNAGQNTGLQQISQRAPEAAGRARGGWGSRLEEPGTPVVLFSLDHQPVAHLLVGFMRQRAAQVA
jgi:hypothetical protein